MTIQRMDHVGIVFNDLAAAKAFFVELGGRGDGRGRLGGPRRGARGRPGGARDGGDPGRPRTARARQVPRSSGGGGDPHAPANTPGIRHVTFAVDNIDAVVARLRARGGELVGEVENYEDIYRLCDVRGPEGIIVELAERIG